MIDGCWPHDERGEVGHRWVEWFFFFSSRRRHTRCSRDWSSDVCSSDLSAATTGPYTAKTDFTVCSGGPCQNYTLAMTPSGSFTTSAPLAANLSNANIDRKSVV